MRAIYYSDQLTPAVKLIFRTLKPLQYSCRLLSGGLLVYWAYKPGPLFCKPWFRVSGKCGFANYCRDILSIRTAEIRYCFMALQPICGKYVLPCLSRLLPNSVPSSVQCQIYFFLFARILNIISMKFAEGNQYCRNKLSAYILSKIVTGKTEQDTTEYSYRRQSVVP